MKRFRFSLQTLLDIRERRENEIRNELSKVVAQQNRERTVQAGLRDDLSRYEERYRERMRQGTLRADEALTWHRFTDRTARAIEAAEERILALEPQAREIRGRLMEAMKKRKVVEKLKDRRYEEYLYEVNREMNNENDDMNQKIYARKLSGEAFGD